MATPSKKAPEIVEQLETQSMAAFGHSRLDSINGDTCVCCGKEAKAFNDELSKKEFTISGLCQICQIEIFGS